MAPTMRRATVLWFTRVLFCRFLVGPLGASILPAPLMLLRASPQAAQDGDPRHYRHDEHQQHYHADRQQHDQRCPAGRRGVSLPHAHNRQVEPVEGKEAPLSRVSS